MNGPPRCDTEALRAAAYHNLTEKVGRIYLSVKVYTKYGMLVYPIKASYARIPCGEMNH